ncbi:MAG: hypothetical protein M1818_007917 [Claussenomyces sp. TS43310]|nr:MAG: hypothetical protein M1818_007917 [Claussenomyces sp. TS43310]
MAELTRQAGNPNTTLDIRVEMFQSGSQEAFFNIKALAPRPLSTATDIYDTEFEDDSDDETGEESPRYSMHSAGRRSETTLSSFEELHTPVSVRLNAFEFEMCQAKSVEGPKGPHLFRASIDLVAQDEDFYLTMSPLTPKATQRPRTDFKPPPIPVSAPIHRPISTLTEILVDWDVRDVARWTPRQVARWMYDAGFEPAIVAKFEENDISGAILVTLKFEDLRELDIPSFGKRHKLWNEIHNLRGSPPPSSPAAATEIDCASEDDDLQHKKSRKHSRRNRKPGFDDLISPLESVSIVGIEQLMPKPHKCAKGVNCSRWRKQQRLINAFHNEHPVSPEGGSYLIAGNPGNPLTAEAARPFSDMVPSVVASSDVLGPGTLPPVRQLEEASLANVIRRDPQDNVKQFLNFQHMDRQMYAHDEPATPPYEMFPGYMPQGPTQPPQPNQPHQNLRSLPKLAIPGAQPPARSASAMGFSPGPMERGEGISPRLRNNHNRTLSPPSVPRFGTPASEMDVPYASVNLSKLIPSRDASQSVPPNMNYHQPSPPIARSQSRSSRRPSFPVLPSLAENVAVGAAHGRHGSDGSRCKDFLAPVLGLAERDAKDANHSGWMKKRKTRMLRHEWHEHHFTLKGTRLAMHKDERALDTLEAIDVDDYAIACSSLASSKLNAALKSLNILRSNGAGKDKMDEAAFSFQLIPAAIEKGQRLRRKGDHDKTHHFAVRSRDERIDWMRELMLAKALKQKGEGFAINVNGNMI